jgi:site-specific recombinase XerD
VLRGDGKSPSTLESYGRSLRQLSAFLTAGGFPPLAAATAEHLREWLNSLRERNNKPATVNTRSERFRRASKWLNGNRSFQRGKGADRTLDCASTTAPAR